MRYQNIFKCKMLSLEDECHLLRKYGQRRVKYIIYDELVQILR